MNLREIINRIKLITGLNQGQVATRIYRTSPNNLSNKISRDTIDIDIIGEWANHCGVSFDWLLSGVGEPYLNSSVDQTCVSGPDSCRGVSQIDGNNLEHAELVKQLIHNKLAMEISHHLLEIERINKSAFKEACAYIKGISVGLKSMVEYDRRQGERRQYKDEKRSADQERRVAERRKAVGE